MNDREKVISEFERCIGSFSPADTSDEYFMCVCKRALELLKEQEPEEYETESSVRQADVETVMNLIEKVLREAGCETVSCDNTLYVFGYKCLSTGGEVQ